jgi:serine/threonine protein kinase
MTKDELRAGARVHGRFTLVKPLGVGGTASVWLARDEGGPGPPSEVALKLLHPGFRRHRAMLQRLHTEALALEELDHPAIARPLAYLEDEQHASLAMELVVGRTLERVLGERARARDHFRHEVLLRIFGDLCGAIAFAHRRGILHRDLKPQNVMLVEQRGELSAKVLDFGIARFLESAADEATTQGRRLGSFFYMAPEQARGDPPDPRCDVFALGSMLFELATLHRAWVRDDQDRPVLAFDGNRPNPRVNAPPLVMARIAAGPRPRPSTLLPELPAALDEVVAKATASAASERYPTADALLEALHEALGAEATVGAREAPTEAREAPPPLGPAPWRGDTQLPPAELMAPGPDTGEPPLATRAEVPPTVLVTAPGTAPTRVDDMALRATRPSTASPAPPSARRSRARRALALFATGLALALLALVVASGPRRERTEPSRPAPRPADATATARAVARPTATARAPQSSSRPLAPDEPRASQRALQASSPRTSARAPTRATPERTQPGLDPDAARQRAPAPSRGADPLGELDAKLAECRANPGDLRRATDLGMAITARARTLEDPAQRARVERLAGASLMSGELADLELALGALRTALGR